MLISDCQLLAPVTCTSGEKISSAAKKLKKQHLRHLYVVDAKKKLVGVFSALDVVYNFIAEGKDYRKVSVKSVMNTNIVSFSKSDPLTKALGFMSQTNVLTSPIIENGKLIGVLAYKDAMAVVIKMKQQLQQQKS